MDNPYSAPASELVSDEEKLEKNVLAPRMKRLGAVIIDWLIYGGSLLLVMFSIDQIFNTNTVQEIFDTSSEEIPWMGFNFLDPAMYLGLAVDSATFLLINGYLLATRGQSVGKVLMNIAIVNAKSREIQPIAELILLRYAPIYLTQLIMYFLYLGAFLIDAVFIFRSDRRTLHDLIAGTIVIDLGSRKKRRKLR